MSFLYFESSLTTWGTSECGKNFARILLAAAIWAASSASLTGNRLQRLVRCGLAAPPSSLHLGETLQIDVLKAGISGVFLRKAGRETAVLYDRTVEFPNSDCHFGVL
jgi:hypothetical protein